ncbi:hypothetical protein ACFVUS_23620 [Nocardia sp. NPDC058058]|uniref:hypothetical protein n=1 Tax=Nocardia sp. NPDC058058 TaxID=3346317 RepID=UPI0036D8EE17
MRRAIIAGGIVGLGTATLVLAAGNAAADTFQPDYSQVANGQGYTPGELLTPGFSPIQVPQVAVENTPGATAIIAHPFIAPWVHEVVPVPSGTAVELRGAVRVQIPDAGGGVGRSLVINPNGHCVFAGPGTDPAALDATALAPVRVDTPIFDLVIEPTLYR